MDNQWQYLVYVDSKKLHPAKLMLEFDVLGREGWELVAVTGVRYIFKRPR